VTLNAKPQLGSRVQGKPTNGKPQVGGAGGPRGIPCSVLCPVPPPPPPAPLLITSATGQAPDEFIQVTLSREAGCNANPPWGIEPPTAGIIGYQWQGANQITLLLGGPLSGGESLTVAGGATSLWARDDGGIVPAGSYPLS